MKRLGLIAILFIIALVFTQCRYFSGRGCGNVDENNRVVSGLTDIKTEFIESESRSIEMSAANTFAKTNLNFCLINKAYADCIVIKELIDFNPWVDSIQVLSNPTYNSSQLTEQLYVTTKSSSDYYALNEYNSNEYRALKMYKYEPIHLEIFEKPTQSDSFKFTFHYYKDGAIIDSSATQKYYIHN